MTWGNQNTEQVGPLASRGVMVLARHATALQAGTSLPACHACVVTKDFRQQ